MTVTTAKWTLDDYHRMIEVGLLYGRQVELLNGEVVEMPPEGPLHAQLSTDAADYLRSLLGYNFRKKMGRLHKPINSFSIRHLISFGNASLTQKACPFFKVPSRGEKALVRDAKPITIPETSSEPEPDLAIVQPLRQVYRTRHPYPENVFWVIEEGEH